MNAPFPKDPCGLAFFFPRICFALAALLAPATGHPQRLQSIVVDPNTSVLQSYIPFDEPFIIKGQVPREVTKVSVVISIYDRADTTEADSRAGTATLYPAGQEKTSFELLVKPIPPNRKLTVTLSFTARIPALDDFTKEARKAIHDFNLRYVTETGNYTAERLNELREGLVKLFRTRYARYAIDLQGTILENADRSRAKFNKLHDLLRHRYDAAANMNNRADSLKPALRAIRDAPHYREFFMQIPAKLPATSVYLSQAIASSDTHALHLMKGTASFEEGSFGAMYLGEDIELSAETSSVVAAAGVKRMEKSLIALRNLHAYFKIYPHAGPYQAEVETILDSLDYGIKSMDTQLGQYRKLADDSYNQTLDDYVKELTFSLESAQVLSASSSNNFETRGSWYISADVGLFAAPQLKEIQPSYGAIIYCTPVNKSGKYRRSDIKEIYCLEGWPATKMWMAKHVGLTVGLTTQSMEDPAKGVSNLWGNTNMLVGLGVRFGPAVRLSGGALLFRGYADGNVLSTEKSVTATPYFAVSVDLDLVKFFGKVGSKLFP